MFLSPTKLLTTLLVLLQLIAPLMHVHASGESFDNGIHLPGLEHFSVTNDSPTFLPINHPLTDEHTIISIGAAIKQNKILSDSSQVFYLLNSIFTLNSVINRVSIFDSLYYHQNHISTAHYTLLPSRASPTKI
ncbi:MAG: hypothetical protein KAH20_00125 [Methylococcales bacterium]|nr:hypothetical protein [Methylococcales bacterium]